MPSLRLTPHLFFLGLEDDPFLLGRFLWQVQAVNFEEHAAYSFKSPKI